MKVNISMRDKNETVCNECGRTIHNEKYGVIMLNQPSKNKIIHLCKKDFKRLEREMYKKIESEILWRFG